MRRTTSICLALLYPLHIPHCVRSDYQCACESVCVLACLHSRVNMRACIDFCFGMESAHEGSTGHFATGKSPLVDRPTQTQIKRPAARGHPSARRSTSGNNNDHKPRRGYAKALSRPSRGGTHHGSVSLSFGSLPLRRSSSRAFFDSSLFLRSVRASSNSLM